MSVPYFEQTMALSTHGPSYKYDYAALYGCNNIKIGKKNIYVFIAIKIVF